MHYTFRADAVVSQKHTCAEFCTREAVRHFAPFVPIRFRVKSICFNARLPLTFSQMLQSYIPKMTVQIKNTNGIFKCFSKVRYTLITMMLLCRSKTFNAAFVFKLSARCLAPPTSILLFHNDKCLRHHCV